MGDNNTGLVGLVGLVGARFAGVRGALGNDFFFAGRGMPLRPDMLFDTRDHLFFHSCSSNRGVKKKKIRQAMTTTIRTRSRYTHDHLGQALLDEERRREDFFRLTDRLMIGEEVFQRTCHAYDQRAKARGLYTLSDWRAIRQDPRD